MIIDSAGRSNAAPDKVGHAFTRAEVIGSPLAAQVFAITDAVFMNETRIAEIRDGS